MENIFPVWQAVVGMIGIAIVWELSRLRKDVKEISKQLNDLAIHMEHRVATLEAYGNHH
jgi:hypothetical protein